MSHLIGRFTRFAIAAGLLVACSEPRESEKNVANVSAPVIDGAVKVTPAGGPPASETATVISQFGSITRHVIAYNYQDPAHETYTATTRTVTAGASHTGWSYADFPNGPFAAPQRLVPPPGWPILWGDPGIGKSAGTAFAFISTLAGPQSKFPASGSTTDVASVLGGGCVARSTNQGRNFTVAASDCLHTSSFEFYDGSDVTGTNSSGPVFAAFNKPGSGARVDVYRAPTPLASFTQLPNPFAGMNMPGHPRLVAGSGTTVYLLGSNGNGSLFLQRYASGWGTSPWPKLITNQFFAATVSLGGINVLRAAQYELVWVSGKGGPGTVLIVYAAKTASGRAILKGARCTDNSIGGCTDNVFTIDPGVNVFSPALGVAYVPAPPSPFPNAIVKGSWLQQHATAPSFVEVFSANLQSASGSVTGRNETEAELPCPTTRGYWGEYDAHLGVYQSSSGANPAFYRSFTDSTDSGCTLSFQHTSEPVQVASTFIPYP